MTAEMLRRRASAFDARGYAGRIMFHGEKRAHGGRMRTYIRPAALLLRSTRIENFVGAHPSLMRAFAGLDPQQPSVIQSEATVREQSEESRHKHG